MERKRTSARLNEVRIVDLDFIKNKHEDTVGISRQTLLNHVAKKIIAGDYDWIDDYQKPTKTAVHIDKELMDEVSKKAKSKGYTTANAFFEEVLKKEKIRQTRGKTKDRYIELFEEIGGTDNGTNGKTTD